MGLLIKDDTGIELIKRVKGMKRVDDTFVYTVFCDKQGWIEQSIHIDKLQACVAP
jgi:hypothetical protein